MPIHATPTDESLSRIASQKRATTITSIVIALLLVTFVGLILFVISMAIDSKSIPPQVTHISPAEPNQNLTIKKINVEVSRRPTPPGGGAPSKVIAPNITSPVTIPISFQPSDNTSFGLDEGLGIGQGTGFDQGNQFNNIKVTPGKRCNTADRLQRLASTGGTKACDDAVIKALRFLQKNQNKDGSWHNKSKVGITGLALLAYLGHCETPLSEEFGDTVFRATVFLVDNGMKNKGRLFHDAKGLWCYEHAIATYALCESYSFSKAFAYQIPGLEDVTTQAVQWIINTPNEIGGWNYTYDEKPRYDTSINAWHMQALKAAMITGLEFKNMRRTTRDALDSIIATQQSHGGFGYNKNGPTGASNGHFTLTGAGTLCVQQHKGTTHRSAKKGVRYLAQNSQFNFAENANLYEHYYTSQALINHGGEEWETYNTQVREQLLSNQAKDGSWPDPAGNKHAPSRIYNTCLATLMLEVYYRYLPGTTKVSN